MNTTTKTCVAYGNSHLATLFVMYQEKNASNNQGQPKLSVYKIVY